MKFKNITIVALTIIAVAIGSVIYTSENNTQESTDTVIEQTNVEEELDEVFVHEIEVEEAEPQETITEVAEQTTEEATMEELIASVNSPEGAPEVVEVIETNPVEPRADGEARTEAQAEVVPEDELLEEEIAQEEAGTTPESEREHIPVDDEKPSSGEVGNRTIYVPGFGNVSSSGSGSTSIKVENPEGFVEGELSGNKVGTMN